MHIPLVSGLIVEGVTGAGKTRTLAALRAHPGMRSWLCAAKFIDEDAVLGPVMNQLNDPALGNRAKWAPMLDVLSRLESEPGRYLMERGHATFFALVPDQTLFHDADRRLHALGFRTVLLHYDEAGVPTRGFDRMDRQGSDWKEGMTRLYGGEGNAIEAIAQSQRRRFECLAGSRLPLMKVDTTRMQWADYARSIAEFLETESPRPP